MPLRLPLLVTALVAVLVALSATAHAQAKPTGVVIDVSGSMQFDAASWRSHARDAVIALVTGGEIDERLWQINPNAAPSVARGEPLYAPGSPLVVLHFGDIDATRVEFFDFIRQESPATLEAAQELVRATFPNTFRDGNTYINVGLAVVRDRMDEVGAGSWYTVLVTDGDQDVPDSQNNNARAREVEDRYRTSVDVDESMRLRYRPDDDLVIIVDEVTLTRPAPPPVDDDSTETPPPSRPAPIGLMAPATGAEVAAAEPPVFRWRPVDGVRRYVVTVTNEAGAVVGRRPSARTTLVWHEPLPPGAYRWRVAASDGSAASQARPFSVAGGGLGGVVLLLFLIALVVGVTTFLRRGRRNRRRDEPLAP